MSGAIVAKNSSSGASSFSRLLRRIPYALESRKRPVSCKREMSYTKLMGLFPCVSHVNQPPRLE